MRANAASRDANMALIREVRSGNMRSLFPDHLTEALGHDGIAVANFIDVVARDLTEVVAPLPALACAAGSMKSDADKRRAERKNRIGDFYWREANLEIQMLKAADRYFSYGFAPFFIEPDFRSKVPIIQSDDPTGAYYELDRFGRPVCYAKMWYKRVDKLAAQFPEWASLIYGEVDQKTGKPKNGEAFLELVRWVDGTNVTLLLPERDGLILTSYKHGLSRPPCWIVERPGLGDTPRGQFDDAVYVQLAKAIMGGLTLEAAEKAVQAPIAIPDDVVELPVGPDAVIQTSQPQNVRRIALEVPPAAFQQAASLDQELHTGTRYPDQRLGQADASVITGRGVQALMGGFDTQVKGAQTMFGNGLRHLTSIAFEYDEVLWPKNPRKIQGTLQGRSYEVTYTPAVDIAGNWSCDITYGFAAGMAPSQSIITLLQLQGAGLISDDTVLMNLPWDMDGEQEKRNVDVQNIEKAMLQGLYSLVQSAGPMIEQGQDPTKILLAAASIAKGRANGGSIEDLMEQAFTKLQQDVQAEQQAAQAAAAPDGGGGPSSPGAPMGATQSAPGQAQLGPGGQPAIQKLIAGMRGNGNTPVLQDTIQRALPAAN